MPGESACGDANQSKLSSSGCESEVGDFVAVVVGCGGGAVALVVVVLVVAVVDGGAAAA